MEERRVIKAEKAYDNKEFVHSEDGRTIRLISEYLYPERYFKENNVNHAIVFYGSARSFPSAEYDVRHEELSKKVADSFGVEKLHNEKQLKRLEALKEMCKYYDECVELAERIGKWSLTLPEDKRFDICTGGGPGMMEAANKGAYQAGCNSIGLNISLPFEQYPNQYITPELNFEFHYFFMRKFWFVNIAQALVAMPGGFGTLDELMENLTLIQTKKLTREIPILLYPKKYWQRLIDFDYFQEMGMISDTDLDLFKYAETPDEAFEFITKELTRIHNL